MIILDECSSRHSQGSIYFNDLPDNLISNLKLLADDTLLFSVVTDANATVNHINNDSHNISGRT